VGARGAGCGSGIGGATGANQWGNWDRGRGGGIQSILGGRKLVGTEVRGSAQG
jgi:hypothetical protein